MELNVNQQHSESAYLGQGMYDFLGNGSIISSNKNPDI